MRDDVLRGEGSFAQGLVFDRDEKIILIDSPLSYDRVINKITTENVIVVTGPKDSQRMMHMTHVFSTVIDLKSAGGVIEAETFKNRMGPADASSRFKITKNGLKPLP